METSIASTRDASVCVDPRDFRRSSARRSPPRQSAISQAGLFFGETTPLLEELSKSCQRRGREAEGPRWGRSRTTTTMTTTRGPSDPSPTSPPCQPFASRAAPTPARHRTGDTSSTSSSTIPPGPSTTTFARRRRRRCRRCWTGSRSSFAATVERATKMTTAVRDGGRRRSGTHRAGPGGFARTGRTTWCPSRSSREDGAASVSYRRRVRAGERRSTPSIGVQWVPAPPETRAEQPRGDDDDDDDDDDESASSSSPWMEAMRGPAGEWWCDAEKAPGFFTVTGRGYGETRIDARGRGRTNDDEGGEEDGDGRG